MDMIKTIEKMVKALEHFEAYPSEREMRDQAVQAGQKLIEELSKQEGEPVAWLITDENINSLQINSIQKLIDRARHAHHTDICLRINGQDEMYEADWLKHMVKATPQQRKPLTNKQIDEIAGGNVDYFDRRVFARAIEAAHGIKE